MNQPTPAFPNVDNAAYLEELYDQFRRDPTSVSPELRALFERPAPGPRTATGHAGTAADPVSPSHELRLFQLVDAYRNFGHRSAHLDPLSPPPALRPELLIETYGFVESDLDRVFHVGGMFGRETAPLRDIVYGLRETYCRTIGAELGHIDDASIQQWLITRMEATHNRLALTAEQKKRIARDLARAEGFERFLEAKFVKKKRFSLEGGESLIPLMEEIVERSAEAGVKEIVIGMAHRGRLNVLANTMRKPAGDIFREFEDRYYADMLGSGDVKYHLGYSSDRTTTTGKKVHLSLAFNPSHLEAIYPVVLGRVRAKQDRIGDTARRAGLALILHGDASFAGQGVVTESLNMSELPGYSTGGTIHVVINNQVGFTTAPSDGRSSVYATGVARMLDVPILHVNGDDPEAVAQCVALAVDFRTTFGKDVVIDLICWRKYGHNEGDDPSFTQPTMYAAIAKRPTIRDGYVKRLVESGVCTQAEADAYTAETRAHLEAELAREQPSPKQPPNALAEVWSQFRGGAEAEASVVKTGLPVAEVQSLARKLVTFPESFQPNQKLVRLGVIKSRTEMAEGSKPFDWATAEALAFASLLQGGTRVRLSGQDVMRGTFSQRHAVYFDQRDGTPYSPLANLSPTQAAIEVRNSPLSEFGVLGFDYGYSLDSPDVLVLWEAQFGDFANGAQVIIDQFLCSAEDKWKRFSGLTLLLPHGYEGQGPEHSNARLDRFLNLSAEDNWQIANVTTPAQYFHILRRQALRPLRKPLVLMTPKSLLRHERAVSSFEEFSGEFQKVIGDAKADPAKVRRVLLCTGKVYYDLEKKRADLGLEDTAIIRIEQLYPYPQQELSAELAKFPRAEKLVWVQEEPWNMGAWYYLRARDAARTSPDSLPLFCVSRPPSASPATGSEKAHGLETLALMEAAFKDELAGPSADRPAFPNGAAAPGRALA